MKEYVDDHEDAQVQIAPAGREDDYVHAHAHAL